MAEALKRGDRVKFKADADISHLSGRDKKAFAQHVSADACGTIGAVFPQINQVSVLMDPLPKRRMPVWWDMRADDVALAEPDASEQEQSHG